jgi:chromosome transmission fidelity protein 1
MMRKAGKTVLKEPRDNAQLERTLFQFSNACGGESPTYELASKTGAILLCVVNGKLSEGINFKDNLGRMVVVVGLPFANVMDEELSARMQYLDLQQKQVVNGSTSSPSAGRLYYEALCARGVNQSVGRAIRHKNDYATMIFLDQRWCEKDKRNSTTPSAALGKYQRTLPGWISRELKVVDGNFGEAVRLVAQFFKSKK